MFGFPQADYTLRLAFKRNFLRAVVIQLQFEETKAFFINKESIHNSFRSDYPRLNAAANVKIQINRNETPIVNSSPGENFLLRTLDGKKQIVFNTNSVEINFQGDYTSFDDVSKNELSKVLMILKQYGIEKLTRTAIRKVNALAFLMRPNTDTVDLAREVLSEAVVTSFLSTPGFNDVNQNINSIHYKLGKDGMNLRIGFNAQLSETIGHFTCDIDRYSTDAVQIDQVSSKMETINREIFDVFMWFLNEKSKTYLLNG